MSNSPNCPACDAAPLRLHTPGCANAEAEDEVPECMFCGLPMAKNPHPNAGEMATLLTVGSEYVCVPCTVKSRHEWAMQARDSQRDQINTRLFYGERMDALQRYQKEMPEPHRTIICNILANGKPRP